MKYFRITLIIFLLTACEKMVTFESPQPAGQPDQKIIPEKLIGHYRSLNDSSLLNITATEIIRTVDWKGKSHLSEVDSVTRLSIHGDTTIIEKDSNFIFEVRGDSLYQSVHHEDILFSLDHGGKIRKLKGYFLMNSLIKGNGWVVSKIGKTKDGLVIGRISTKDDLDKLRELTKTDADSIYSFNPTKRQMKKFVRENGFGDDERL